MKRRQRVLRRALTLCISALLASSALAQVNTEAFRPTGAESGLSGALQFDLAARRGNSETEGLGLGLRLFHATPMDAEHAARVRRPVPAEQLSPSRLLMLIADYDFAESSGERAVNRGFVHLRSTWMNTPRFGWEAFGQLETDEFTRLDRRSLLGGGFRYGIFQRPKATLFIGQGAMGEWERIDAPVGGGAFQGTRNDIRLTSYLVGRWKSTDDRVELAATMYVQPVVDAPEDVRVLFASYLRTAITERWSLRLELDVRHDNEPEDGVDETDVEISSGFGFRF